MFFFSVARIFALSSWFNEVPILVVWCVSVPICTCSSSSMGLTLLSWNSSLGSRSRGLIMLTPPFWLPWRVGFEVVWARCLIFRLDS
ncbi:hypothetical protein QL285_045840 [Trifolium repens]|nr:hypothetical protein QL285_045840 [Trifolium repens]